MYQLILKVHQHEDYKSEGNEQFIRYNYNNSHYSNNSKLQKH